jgi:hypothetical protein
VNHRRRWLQALGLGLVGAHGGLTSVTWADAAPLLRIGATRLLRRWPTGNARLAPVSFVPSHEAGALFSAGLLFAGETTQGLIDPRHEHPLWVRPHALPGGAVFRPRTAAGTALGAGHDSLGSWRLRDGEPLWRRPAERQWGVPCLMEEAVFVGDGHALLALDLATGGLRWRVAATLDTLISYAPVATRELVLVGLGDGRLYALERATGQLRWECNRQDDWKYLRQLHLASDHLLIAGGYTEKLYGIDLASGDTRWTFSAGNFINSHHVVGEGVYLWSPTGWIYALDLYTGEVRWRHRTTGYRGSPHDWAPLVAELASSEDRLFALDLGHILHVLAMAGGEELARYPLAAVQPFVTPLDRWQVALGGGSGELWLVALDEPAYA